LGELILDHEGFLLWLKVFPLNIVFFIMKKLFVQPQLARRSRT